MFNDPIMEIQELTALIKTDITTLNSAVLDLQTIQKIDLADENYSEDRVVHSNAVCDDLKNKLMGATKHLQDVLTTRTEVNNRYSCVIAIQHRGILTICYCSPMRGLVQSVVI
jgi:hypothetical protein